MEPNNDYKQYEYTIRYDGPLYNINQLILSDLLHPIYEDFNIDYLYINNLEDIMLRNALNESLEMYTCNELKPNVNIDVDSKQSDIESSCSICQDDIIMSEEVIHLECKHTYHSECIKKWVKYKAECPICRASIKTTTSSLNEKNDS